MRIRIPRFLTRWWDRYGDWANVPVWQRTVFGLHLEVRRLDIQVAIGFLFTVGYSWVSAGWFEALRQGTLFIFLGMVALWFFPRDD